MDQIVRNFAWIFICYLFSSVLIGVNPTPVIAQEQSEQQADSELLFNETVVKNLFNGGDPDVAFLARSQMMVGHLIAADYAIESGNLTEARLHITRAQTEVQPEIIGLLEKRNLKHPSAAIDSIIGALQSGEIEQTRTEIYDAIVEIESWQHAIDPKKMVMDQILADTAVLLIRTAITAHNKAIKGGKIVNIVEYHVGSAFVTEATTLIREAEYEWKTRNPAAYKQLELSLQELQAAWPYEIPPLDSIIPLGRILELATIVEGQMNQIRKGNDAVKLSPV